MRSPFPARPVLFLMLPLLCSPGAAPAALAQTSCEGDLRDTIVESAIDLSARGVKPARLGTEFRLAEVSVRDEGTCAGGATSGLLVDAVWAERESRREVRVVQRPGVVHAPVLEEHAARFSSGGYGYAVSLDPRPVASASASVSSRDLLLAVLRALAPDLDEKCFSRATRGTWSDLAALGLRDPRPALPTGFKESGLDLQFLAPPDPSCGGVPAAPSQVSLDATFSDGDEGILRMSVRELPLEGSQSPGALDDSGILWFGRYRSEISGAGTGGAPVGRDAVLALARELDPELSTDCLLQSVTLTLEEVLALGFREPKPSDAFVLVESSFVRTAVAESCSQPLAFRGQYALAWTFEEKDPGARGIAVSVVRPVVTEGIVPSPVIAEDGFLAWTDAKGTSFSVDGFFAGEDGISSFDDELVQVALSLDPTLVIEGAPSAP